MMKKKSILNLIKYHVERNESAFRNEAVEIARYFDSIGDDELAEYIMGLIAEANVYSPQASEYEGTYLKQIDVETKESLRLPISIADDLKGVINAISHDIGINKFLFEGLPGSGKTEAAKNVAKIMDRNLFYVDFDKLIDSKLGQSNRNIVDMFEEIGNLSTKKKSIVLFDEIDAIALNRVDSNDIREMGRVTSTILKELDRLSDLNKDVVIIATTNLFSNFDKALIRRFDAVINFDRYEKEDLVEIGELFFTNYSKDFKTISKDTKLVRKMLMLAKELPYPGELKNLIKKSLAFSDPENKYDYLIRLYNSLIGNIEKVDVNQLYDNGFTMREIEKLKGESKSTVSRKVNKG